MFYILLVAADVVVVMERNRNCERKTDKIIFNEIEGNVTHRRIFIFTEDRREKKSCINFYQLKCYRIHFCFVCLILFYTTATQKMDYSKQNIQQNIK